MRIFIKTITGKSITLEVTLSNTVINIKEMIEAKEKIPVDQQVLLWGSKCRLKDDLVLDNF